MSSLYATCRTPLETARAVADAVRYQADLRHPYRRSSGKNRVRWQFGVRVPRSWLAASVADDTGVAGSPLAWRRHAPFGLHSPMWGATHG